MLRWAINILFCDDVILFLIIFYHQAISQPFKKHANTIGKACFSMLSHAFACLSMLRWAINILFCDDVILFLIIFYHQAISPPFKKHAETIGKACFSMLPHAFLCLSMLRWAINNIILWRCQFLLDHLLPSSNLATLQKACKNHRKSMIFHAFPSFPMHVDASMSN